MASEGQGSVIRVTTLDAWKVAVEELLSRIGMVMPQAEQEFRQLLSSVPLLQDPPRSAA